MPRLQSIKNWSYRRLRSLPFFVLLGLALGSLISIPLIPQPNIAVITISGPILDQTYADDILDMLEYARKDNQIKAIVLQIDSPGGAASAIEPIYLDLLRLRQRKPLVVSVGTIAASGGYYMALASNYIYAAPTSQIGSIGALVGLPEPEELGEDIGATGPFKTVGGSRRKVMSQLEMVRREFVEAVTSQRGDRLKLTEEELSQAEIYVGVEGLRYGLIDEIGTRTNAIAKAAELAGLRNYQVVELHIISVPLFWYFSSSDWAMLKAQTGLIPQYYYLYFESR